jgi:hypothetical protein
MHNRRDYGLALALLGLAGGAGGCGHADTACPAEDGIQGVCAGVPAAPVCSSGSCTEGVSCAHVVPAADDASLAQAIASASPGTCITLSPGSYKAADLPGGVSLLGRSAADVTVGEVTLGAGDGAVLRGVAVGSGGLTIGGATHARVESVRVSAAAGVGVLVAAQSSVDIVSSSVEGSGLYNLEIDDGAQVTIDQSILSGADGPGLWAACAADCACTAKPKLTMTNSIVRDNHIGGVVLFGATASFNGVDILRTVQGDKIHFGEGGGGLSVARCSDVTASDLLVSGSGSFGVLVDGASAALGSENMEGGVQLTENVVGLWVSNVPTTESVSLMGATVEGNQGVGVGVSGDTQGFIMCKTHINSTQLSTLPVYKNGMVGFVQQVGDGLSWLGGSQLFVDEVTLSGNARASVVIDGTASGSLKDITLQGGDESKGIVEQNYTGGSTPTIGPGAPTPSVQAAEMFAVPVAPAAIARTL